MSDSWSIAHSRQNPALLEAYRKARRLGGGLGDFQWAPLQFDRFCLSPPAEILFALCRGEPCALIAFAQLPEAVEVQYFEVLDSYQSQGLGTWLFTSFLEFWGRGQIWLEVHEANLRAQAFYKKFGFSQVGERRAYYHDGKKALLLSATNPLGGIGKEVNLATDFRLLGPKERPA